MATLKEQMPHIPKSVDWYIPTIPEGMFSESTKRILRDYSGIPDEQVEKHVYEIRDKAWEVFPYACTGRFTFLQLSIGTAPQYDEVLARVKAGERLLDFGCNFGQDLRKLVYDGAPSENLYGSDVHQEFFSLGYELFNDRDTIKSNFIAADALAETSMLDELKGTISIIHASSFFHLFDRPTQVKLGVRCVSLLQHKPGALIFGRQSGHENAGHITSEAVKALGESWQMFRHNEESWREMWDEIGALTGTSWEAEAYLYEDETTRLPRKDNADRTGAKRMRFAVRMK